MKLLVFSNNEFLMGVLQSYGHATGCHIKSLNDLDIFLKSIIKESPSMVFVDVELTEKIISSPHWTKTWQFMQKNKIALCGVGKQLANNTEVAQGVVYSNIFTLPLNVDEVHDFLHTRIFPAELVSHERRYVDRRRGDRRSMDRRERDRRSEDRRKPNNQSNVRENHTVGPLFIDYFGKMIKLNGVEIEISPKEFELIDLLAQQPDSVVKTEDIVNTVWPENYKATKADVHQYVHMLRKKIEKNPHKPQLLVTVKGFGYKLCP